MDQRGIVRGTCIVEGSLNLRYRSGSLGPTAIVYHALGNRRSPAPDTIRRRGRPITPETRDVYAEFESDTVGPKMGVDEEFLWVNQGMEKVENHGVDSLRIGWPDSVRINPMSGAATRLAIHDQLKPQPDLV
jgi:hypothetical protein